MPKNLVILVFGIAVAMLPVSIGCVRSAAPTYGQLLSRGAAPTLAVVDVTVTEGTSMSVAVSPDGRTLAIDLQGSIWTLPAIGGPAKRITDLFNDARQPVWSPDGKWITFFAYRDGSYDVWAIAPDGSNQHQLTWGPFDDREPVWSHDGTRLAFSSDRGDPLGSDYNIWLLDSETGALRQLTKDKAEDYMPTWSPDDTEIAFASTRGDGRSVWAVSVADGTERKVAASANGRLDAPSWGPDGRLVYHVTASVASQFESNGQPLTGSENVFPFRASWNTSSEFFYVSDGRIRKRAIDATSPQTIEFSAVLQVARPQYARRKRDVDSTAPRQALGVVHPVVSPDGTKIAFAALGDIYVMPMGGKPKNLTSDPALDTDPAWSPDSTQLVYSSDKGSGLQLWVHDMRTQQERQLTSLTTPPIGAAWSPDGKRIAFLGVDGGGFRRAGVSVIDVATGGVTKILDVLPGPGTPTWSPDSKRLALAMLAPYSTRYREGTNQVLTIAADGSAEQWYAPIPTLSIDSRDGCGPVWSPDGTKMAAIYEGILVVWPVASDGKPLAAPRRMTTEMAHSPSWTGDSQYILYQSMDKLRLIKLDTGDIQDVPVDLKYTPDVPKNRLVVHAGRLIDMKSQTPRSDVDIVVEGNRIRAVRPHSADLHKSGELVDGSGLTVMPGLIEFHSHLQKDFGEALGRAWLAFGITTVRSAASTPYEAVEDREANEAGVRPGPRIYGTGYLMEWMRNFHKMSVVISSPAHLEMELQRAKVLQHDFIKSYVRLPDLQQRRITQFAHDVGIPVATHEIYPAAFVGVDNTEHTAGTSRRGYSPKIATLQRSYSDVAQLFGKSGRVFCPTNSRAGVPLIFASEPGLKNDPRFKLYPEWVQRQIAQQSVSTPAGGAQVAGAAKMIMDAKQAGALIVAGTDTLNGINIHGELAGFVHIGMTPFEALKTATVNPAQALNLDAGTIEAGKLADMVMVDGDPLVNIMSTHRVKRVIANGRVYGLDQLLNGVVSKNSTNP